MSGALAQPAVVRRDQWAEVLCGLAGPIALHRSIRVGALRQAFESLLTEQCLPANVEVTCEVRRVKFKPGRKLTVTYDVSAGPGGLSRPVVAVWTLGAVEKARAMAAAPEARSASNSVRPFTQLAAADPGAGLRLLIAPHDPACPQLAAFSNPARLAGVLRVAGIDPGGGYRPCMVRYRPGERHVLFLVEAADEAPRFVAKLYPRGGAGRVADMARAVATACLAGGARLAVPPAWRAGEAAVVSPAAPGRPLSWWLTHRPREAHAHVVATGAALRALHGAPTIPEAGRVAYDTGRELTTTGRASEHIQVLLPDVARRIADLLTRAAAGLADAARGTDSLIHGDFKADHVLVSPSGLALIDVDRSGRCDAALDVAKFLADLHWWVAGPAGSSDLDVAGAQAAFLDGYGVEVDLLRRARILEAVLVLRLAARRPGLHTSNWATLTDALVARAERVSEGWGHE